MYTGLLFQLRDRQAGYPHRGADPACLPLPYQYRLYPWPDGQQRPAHPTQSIKMPPKQRTCAICFGGCLFGTKYVSIALKGIVHWDSHSDVMATIKYGAILRSKNRFIPTVSHAVFPAFRAS